MFKFLVLAVLVFGCNALPNPVSGQAGYQSSYQSSSSYGSSGQGASGLLASQPQSVSTISVAQPVSVGVQYGSSSGIQSSGSAQGYGAQVSGLSTGYGVSSGYGQQQQQQQYTTGAGQQNNWQQYLTVHQGQQFQQVVPAAIQQISRTVEYLEQPYQENAIQAQVVEIEPSDNPVHLHFKTRSSTLSASQSHEAAQAGEVQTAQAQDEVQRLYTEVQKPVVQDVKEIITPYRQVTQVIQPVVESLHTQVTRGQGQRAQYNAAGLVQQYSSNQQYSGNQARGIQSYGGAVGQQYGGAVQQYSAFGNRAQTIPVATGYSAQVAQQTVARPVGFQAGSGNYQQSSSFRSGHVATPAVSHSTFSFQAQPLSSTHNSGASSRSSYSSSSTQQQSSYKRA